MKSTFVFIAMLLFVNCSQDLFTPKDITSDVDPALVEISKDPSSEAVFATMAIQLEARGGFRKVLHLLNSLVHDSRMQLHSMTKIWRGVEARCQVSKIKLAGRQEFFNTYLGQARKHVIDSRRRLFEVKGHLKGFGKSLKVYKKILGAERRRHHFAKTQIKKKYRFAKLGLKSIKAAFKAVKNWSPKGRALVQTHLEEVSKSYLQVKDYELPNITELLERTTDRKVRRRLLEWMRHVRRQILIVFLGLRSTLKRLIRVGRALDRALVRMVKALRKGIRHLRKSLIYLKHMIRFGVKNARLFARLARQNLGLIRASRRYCTNEKRLYVKNRRAAIKAMRLFRVIRRYFIKHYRGLHSYIKAKYTH